MGPMKVVLNVNLTHTQRNQIYGSLNVLRNFVFVINTFFSIKLHEFCKCYSMTILYFKISIFVSNESGKC